MSLDHDVVAMSMHAKYMIVIYRSTYSCQHLYEKVRASSRIAGTIATGNHFVSAIVF